MDRPQPQMNSAKLWIRPLRHFRVFVPLRHIWPELMLFHNFAKANFHCYSLVVGVTLPPSLSLHAVVSGCEHVNTSQPTYLHLVSRLYYFSSCRISPSVFPKSPTTHPPSFFNTIYSILTMVILQQQHRRESAQKEQHGTSLVSYYMTAIILTSPTSLRLGCSVYIQ